MVIGISTCRRSTEKENGGRLRGPGKLGDDRGEAESGAARLLVRPGTAVARDHAAERAVEEDRLAETEPLHLVAHVAGKVCRELARPGLQSFHVAGEVDDGCERAAVFADRLQQRERGVEEPRIARVAEVAGHAGAVHRQLAGGRPQLPHGAEPTRRFEDASHDLVLNVRDVLLRIVAVDADRVGRGVVVGHRQHHVLDSARGDSLAHRQDVGALHAEEVRAHERDRPARMTEHDRARPEVVVRPVALAHPRREPLGFERRELDLRDADLEAAERRCAGSRLDAHSRPAQVDQVPSARVDPRAQVRKVGHPDRPAGPIHHEPDALGAVVEEAEGRHPQLVLRLAEPGPDRGFIFEPFRHARRLGVREHAARAVEVDRVEQARPPLGRIEHLPGVPARLVRPWSESASDILRGREARNEAVIL